MSEKVIVRLVRLTTGELMWVASNHYVAGTGKTKQQAITDMYENAAKRQAMLDAEAIRERQEP